MIIVCILYACLYIIFHWKNTCIHVKTENILLYNGILDTSNMCIGALKLISCC